MKQFLIVGAGGFLGAGLRYLAYRLVSNTPFPGATLFVNVFGCFLIGLLAAYLQESSGSEYLKLFLLVGLLGGFTTYSSFGLDSYLLLKESQFLSLFMSVASHLLFGLLAVMLGFKVSEML